MADVAKTININYNGKTYTLEFSRSVVRMMEQQGFDLNNIDRKPINTIPALFAGAFRKNHSSVSRKLIDEIYEKMTHRTELVSKLAEMYGDTVSTLFDEPDEDDEGNANWDPSW